LKYGRGVPSGLGLDQLDFSGAVFTD